MSVMPAARPEVEAVTSRIQVYSAAAASTCTASLVEFLCFVHSLFYDTVPSE